METGRWILINNTYFEGEFSKNKPNGGGSWHFTNGNTLAGRYEQTITRGDAVEEEQAEDEKARETVKVEWIPNGNLKQSCMKYNSIKTEDT